MIPAILVQSQASGFLNEALLKAIVINLFVLSLINERVCNFLKLNTQAWFPDPEKDADDFKNANVVRKTIGETFRNLRVVERADKDREAIRAKAILNLAVICGIIIAFLAQADLFYLVQKGTLRTKFCDFNEDGFVSQFLGWILTGFFISLGSKFWHDVLDIVLYSSNLKRALTEKETFAIDKADQLTTLLSFTPSELAGLAYQQHNTYLTSLSNVAYTVVGTRRINGEVKHCIMVYLKDNDTSRIPKTLPVQLPNNVAKQVEVIVIPNTAIPEAHWQSGNRIGPKGSLFQGTVCGLLRNPDQADGVVYLLTCCHVLNNRSSRSPGGFIENPASKPPVQGNGQPDGIWVYGLLNFLFDLALVQLPDAVGSELFRTARPKDIYPVEPTIIERHTPVTVIRQEGRGQSTGELVAYRFEKPTPMRYNDGIVNIEDLLLISTNDSLFGQALSEEGDSGALVYETTSGRALGMIIGGDGNVSYAIPMQSILNMEEINSQNLQLFSAINS